MKISKPLQTTEKLITALSQKAPEKAVSELSNLMLDEGAQEIRAIYESAGRSVGREVAGFFNPQMQKALDDALEKSCPWTLPAQLWQKLPSSEMLEVLELFAKDGSIETFKTKLQDHGHKIPSALTKKMNYRQVQIAKDLLAGDVHAADVATIRSMLPLTNRSLSDEKTMTIIEKLNSNPHCIAQSYQARYKQNLVSVLQEKADSSELAELADALIKGDAERVRQISLERELNSKAPNHVSILRLLDTMHPDERKELQSALSLKAQKSLKPFMLNNKDSSYLRDRINIIVNDKNSSRRKRELIKALISMSPKELKSAFPDEAGQKYTALKKFCEKHFDKETAGRLMIELTSSQDTLDERADVIRQKVKGYGKDVIGKVARPFAFATSNKDEFIAKQLKDNFDERAVRVRLAEHAEVGLFDHFKRSKEHTTTAIEVALSLSTKPLIGGLGLPTKGLAGKLMKQGIKFATKTGLRAAQNDMSLGNAQSDVAKQLSSFVRGELISRAMASDLVSKGLDFTSIPIEYDNVEILDTRNITSKLTWHSMNTVLSQIERTMLMTGDAPKLSDFQLIAESIEQIVNESLDGGAAFLSRLTRSEAPSELLDLAQRLRLISTGELAKKVRMLPQPTTKWLLREIMDQARLENKRRDKRNAV